MTSFQKDVVVYLKGGVGGPASPGKAGPPLDKTYINLFSIFRSNSSLKWCLYTFNIKLFLFRHFIDSSCHIWIHPSHLVQ